MIQVGVIGYGYWGPNIVRNLYATPGFCVHTVCDKSPECLQRARNLYPAVKFTQDVNDILQSTEIDVVAVITPAWTHYELAKSALLNGKHI
jgi:predicted dehydrogenase